MQDHPATRPNSRRSQLGGSMDKFVEFTDIGHLFLPPTGTASAPATGQPYDDRKHGDRAVEFTRSMVRHERQQLGTPPLGCLLPGVLNLISRADRL